MTKEKGERTDNNKKYLIIGKDLDQFILENSIGWELAIVKKINKFSATIETKKILDGIINYENIS